MPETPPGLLLPPPGPPPDDQPSLTDEQRMLVDLRDVLYEGSWADFRLDLTARRESRPHVFDTIPECARLNETIDRHMGLIDELERWERHYALKLRGTRLPAGGGL